MARRNQYDIELQAKREEARKKEIEKVTKEDIIKFSKKIHMDTIYLLEGEA